MVAGFRQETMRSNGGATSPERSRDQSAEALPRLDADDAEAIGHGPDQTSSTAFEEWWPVMSQRPSISSKVKRKRAGTSDVSPSRVIWNV